MTGAAAADVGILFTAGRSPLSRFIMWGLSEPSSHLAVDLPGLSVVVHSDLSGVHTTPRDDFMASHSVVDRFSVRLKDAALANVEKKLLTYGSETSAGYDYGAFASLAVSGLKAKLLGSPFPLKSKWQSDDRFLCTELCYVLNQFIVEETGKVLFFYDQDIASLSPWMVRSQLVKVYGESREISLQSGHTFLVRTR